MRKLKINGIVSNLHVLKPFLPHDVIANNILNLILINTNWVLVTTLITSFNLHNRILGTVLNFLNKNPF